MTAIDTGARLEPYTLADGELYYPTPRPAASAPPTGAGGPQPKRKRRPKDIGTAGETAVCRFLAAHGFPGAERRALRGQLDAGDITGTPGICWEIKGGNAAKDASDKQIRDWLNETATETANAHSDAGVLVLQRRGVGPANAGRWWAILPGWQMVFLGMDDYSHTRQPALLDFPVRLLLADVVQLLRAAGYGDPLPAIRPATETR